MSCQFRPWRLPGAKVGKTGHDLALGQVSVAHQSLPAVSGQACGMSAEQSRDFGLDRLRQRRSRATA